MVSVKDFLIFAGGNGFKIVSMYGSDATGQGVPGAIHDKPFDVADLEFGKRIVHQISAASAKIPRGSPSSSKVI